MVDPYFHEVISALLLSILNEEKHHYYSIDILIKLFKQIMASKLYINEGFNLIEEALDTIPYLNNDKHPYDPVFHLLQTLPLIDHGSEELYSQWNETKMDLFQKWCSMGTKELIDKSNVLEILPYEVVKDSLEYSHLFQLITEQYIEDKVTKNEFQAEVRDLSQSAEQKFKSQTLKSHEDPCLICINDLTFLLKNKNKRVRAYGAFNFLLQSTIKSPFIVKQQKYLELRRQTEDLIISKVNLLEKNKIFPCEYYSSLDQYFNSLSQMDLPQDLHIQDPILDALELESISLLEKIEFQKNWLEVLNKFNAVTHVHQAWKIDSYFTFEQKQLLENDIENYLKKIVLSLKTLKKPLNSKEMLSEIDMISNLALSYLPKEKREKLKLFVEKTFGTNLARFAEK
jgi:hypothetical protein